MPRMLLKQRQAAGDSVSGIQDMEERERKAARRVSPSGAYGTPCDEGLSGTPDLNRYYETGELPEDPLQRKAFLLLIENGEI